MRSIFNPINSYLSQVEHVQGGPKLVHFFQTLTNFQTYFTVRISGKIFDNTVNKDPTTSQLCRYTTLWNVNVFNAATENKTTFVTTYFKKLATGNCLFLSQLLSKVTATSSRFYIKVQCFRLAAGRRNIKTCCYRSRLVSIVALKTLTFHKVV